MKSAVLCCLVVLSLGLSAAPMPVAADVGMGSMLSVITRGLLSVDAHKKPTPKKKPTSKKKPTKPKPTKKKATKAKPTKKKPTKHTPTKKKPTKHTPTKKKPVKHTPTKPHPKPHPKPTPPKAKPTVRPTPRPVAVPASPNSKNTIPKGAPGVVQPDISDPTPNTPKAGSGKCVSGSFTIFNSPLVPFASAKATCSSAGMVLASISTIFEPDNNALMQAAQTAIEGCQGSNQQVWFDTTLTSTDSPPTCNAFMVTNQPTAGTTTTAGRRLAATPLILLASSVPTGCSTKLPVLCVKASATS